MGYTEKHNGFLHRFIFKSTPTSIISEKAIMEVGVW